MDVLQQRSCFGGAESAADLAPAGGSLASPTKFCTSCCTRGTSSVALRQMLRHSHISVVIAPMAHTIPVVILRLLTRAHSAALPSPCNAVRSQMWEWIAVMRPELTV